MKTYQWPKLNDQQKKEVSFADAAHANIDGAEPIFILGSRQIASARIQELTSKLIQKRPVIWGCLLEQYIPGLEDAPQFKTLPLKKLRQSLATLESELEGGKAQVNILQYNFRHTKYILRELQLSAVIGVYGSWHRAFHFTPLYFELQQKDLPYKLVSGFMNEKAAKKYGRKLSQIETTNELLKSSLAANDLPASNFAGNKAPEVDLATNGFVTNGPSAANMSTPGHPGVPGKKFSDQELLKLAKQVSHFSCDYTFQTGAILARDQRVLAAAYNRVVPYKTYILHHGASKEAHFSPSQDLNYFDTNHAEVELLIKASQAGLDLSDSSLFINLLPCPNCARMLARTPIAEIVYQHDHSQGYAFKLLQGVGKQVRRVAV